MKKIIFFITTILLSLTLNAQYQTFGWFVGSNNFFNFVQPVVVGDPFPEISTSGTNMNSNYGIVSDSSGTVVVYSKNGDLYFPTTSAGVITAPIGTTPAPNQSCVIMGEETFTPGTMSVNVLSLAYLTAATKYNLYYSAGLVSQGETSHNMSPAVTIASNLSSKMAVYYDGFDTTIIVHELGNNSFGIFTDLSMSTTFNIGPSYGMLVGGDYDSGFMKFSSWGYKLAVSSPNVLDLRIYNFDKFSSQLTNEVVFSGKAYNAIEFAAGDEYILYAATDYDIYQIDLTYSTTTSIGTSSNLIKNMQVGADGKIYVSKAGGNTMGIIHNPEIRGIGCHYIDNEISLPSTSNGALPTFPANYFNSIPIVDWTSETGSDTVYVGENIWFNINGSMMNTTDINWDFGDGNTHFGDISVSNIYSTPGIYNLYVDIPFFDFVWNNIRLTKKVVVVPAPTMFGGAYEFIQTHKWMIGDNILSFAQSDNLSSPFPRIETSFATINLNNAVLTDRQGNILAHSNQDILYFPTISNLHNFNITPSQTQSATLFANEIAQDLYSFECLFLGGDGFVSDLHYLYGDISSTSLSIYDDKILGSNLSSKMATINYEGIKKIVVHELGTNIFRTYDDFVNSSYITSPIGNNYGNSNGSGYDLGYMKFSPWGEYLAVSSPGMDELIIYNYDQSSNTITNEAYQSNGSSLNINAIEFSAGNPNILYVASDHEIYQIVFNMGTDNSFTHIGSSTSSTITNMQLGPDGKIYVAKQGDSHLGVIYNPEIIGGDCFYKNEAIALSNPNGTLPAFPASFAKYSPIVHWYNNEIVTDSIFVNQEAAFEVWNNLGIMPVNIKWDFGDGATSTSTTSYHTYATSGTYNLKVKMFFDAGNTNRPWDSVMITKKVIIHETPIVNLIEPDTTVICNNGDEFDLLCTSTTFVNKWFVWSDEVGTVLSEGINVNTFHVTQAGKYILDIKESSTATSVIATDTAIVYGFNPNFTTNPFDNFQINENIDFFSNLNPTPLPYDDIYTPTYYWDFGDGVTQNGTTSQNVSNTYTSAGTYEVMLDVSIDACSFSYTQTIEVLDLSNGIIEPQNSIICTNDGTNSVTLKAIIAQTYYDYIWTNSLGITLLQGAGEYTYEANTAGVYYLEILNDGTQIFNDSATVYWFDPEFTIAPTPGIVNENVFFESFLNEIPFPYNYTYTPTYDWDFGDGTTQSGTELEYIEHYYSETGLFYNTLDIEIGGCIFSYSNTINVFDGYIIEPENSVVCSETETSTLTTTIDYGSYYRWYSADDLTNTLLEGVSAFSYDANYGDYILEIDIDGNPTYTGTATVYYFEPSFTSPPSANVNDEVIFVSYLNETPNPYNFTYTPTYNWDFGDGTTQSGTEWNDIAHTYNTSGNYVVTLDINIGNCDFQTSNSISIFDGYIIEPENSVVCSETETSTLTTTIDYGSYYRWYSADDLTNTLLEGVSAFSYDANYGDYILEIDIDGTPTYTESATVYYFEPSFTSPPSANVNDEVIFVSYLNETPNPYNFTYTPTYNWDFGDDTTQSGTEWNDIAHTYNTSGNYTVTLDINIEDCDFQTSNSISIFGNNVPHIFPKDTVLCDTSIYFPISMNVDMALYDVYWYSDNGLFNGNENQSEIWTNQPGNYWAEVYEVGTSTALMIDTAHIEYKKCYDINVNILTNESYTCDNNTTFNFEAEITEFTSPCSIPSLSDFYFIWDMGNGDSFQDFGMTNVDYSYPYGGNYKVSLYIFDPKDCDLVTNTNVLVQGSSPDTAYVYLYENTFDDFDINLKEHQVFRSNFLANNNFTKFSNLQLYSNNVFSDKINIPQGHNSTIEDANDFHLYTRIAYEGNFSLKLISPSGNTFYATDVYDDTLTYLLGHPANDFYSYDMSICKSYFFTNDGEDINTLDIGRISPLYYSPDKQLTWDDKPFYYVQSDFYDFQDAEAMVGEPVSGEWTLEFYGEGGNGKLDTWGLTFPNQYFFRLNKPDSLTCIDQFGNTYNTTDSILTITNSGTEQYILDCKAKYNITGCVKNKTIVITIPVVPNVFTPNGDGINDTWKPVSEGVDVDIIIMDKNGQIVANFRSTDNIDGWDGKFNGKPLPSDSYWYIISYLDGNITKGVVSIVR